MTNSKRKVKNNKLPVAQFEKQNIVLPVTEIQSRNVVFSLESFKCTSINNKIFNNKFSNIEEYAKWSLYFISYLSKYSTMKSIDIKTAGKAGRCHTVKDNELKKLKGVLQKLGYNLNEQIEEYDYYQISVGTSNGRVYGYFIDNIFYILLLDPHHLIYEDKKHGAKHCLQNKKFDPWELLK